MDSNPLSNIPTVVNSNKLTDAQLCEVQALINRLQAPQPNAKSSHIALGEDYRNRHFFYLEREPTVLYPTVQYKEYYGLDFSAYNDRHTVHKALHEEALAAAFPREFGETGYRKKVIPNREACNRLRSPIRFYLKPWDVAFQPHKGIGYVNKWVAPYWWRVNNNETAIGEVVPQVCEDSILPIEDIVNGILMHLLNNQLEHVNMVITWLYNSVLGRNDKSLCIFGKTGTGKSIVTELMLNALHGSNWHACDNISNLFKDQFTAGTLSKKTALSLPELHKMNPIVLKQFLNFISSDKIVAHTKYEQTENISDSHLNVAISANPENGKAVFPHNRPELMRRVIIFISTDDKIFNSHNGTEQGAEIMTSKNNKYYITRADIERIANMREPKTDQAKYDQLQFVKFIKKAAESAAINIKDDTLSGYVHVESGFDALKASFNAWQNRLFIVIGAAIENRKYKLDETKEFYVLDRIAVKMLAGDFNSTIEAADYKQDANRPLSIEGIYSYLTALSPVVAKASCQNREHRKLLFSKQFVEYLQQTGE